MKLDKCKSCGTEMIWAKTPAGKLMPLDRTPTADGMWALDEAEGACYFVSPGSFAFFDGPRHHSHFATCPDAAKHRKRKP
jgi:hypothetical protein